MENVLKDNFLGTLSFVHEEQSFVDTLPFFFDAGSLIILCYSENGPKSMSLTKPVMVSFGVSQNSVVKNYYYVLLHGQLNEVNGADSEKVLKGVDQGIQQVIAKRIPDEVQLINGLSHWIKSNQHYALFRLQINSMVGKEYTALRKMNYL